jgi:hypothetical protein
MLPFRRMRPPPMLQKLSTGRATGDRLGKCRPANARLRQAYGLPTFPPDRRRAALAAYDETPLDTRFVDPVLDDHARARIRPPGLHPGASRADRLATQEGLPGLRRGCLLRQLQWPSIGGPLRRRGQRPPITALDRLTSPRSVSRRSRLVGDRQVGRHAFICRTERFESGVSSPMKCARSGALDGRVATRLLPTASYLAENHPSGWLSEFKGGAFSRDGGALLRDPVNRAQERSPRAMCRAASRAASLSEPSAPRRRSNRPVLSVYRSSASMTQS